MRRATGSFTSWDLLAPYPFLLLALGVLGVTYLVSAAARSAAVPAVAASA